MKLKVFFYLLFVFAISPSYTRTNSWKILFYMDASDKLSDMAIKGITDMVRAKPADTVEILVQLHAYHDSGLRYRITDAGIGFVQEITLDKSEKKNLVDAAAWAFDGHASDHTMLILSNHGWGVLDPQYNQETQQWEGEFDQMNACPVSTLKSRIHDHIANRHRGFMFNNTTKIYLNNQDLTEALDLIKRNSLRNTPFDILAFDTCMGAMLEVAYQVAPYAHYLIGSQSCSLPDGFEYQGIVAKLNQTDNSPASIAHGMVETFDGYYNTHDTSGIYTHAALNLRAIEPVLHAIDTLVPLALALPNSQELLEKVRDASPRFCMWPMYTDPVAFFILLNTMLDDSEHASTPTDLKDAIDNAVAALQTAMQSFVLARCGGFETRDVAHGCSIYSPFGFVDSCYYKTFFAKDNRWIELLETLAGTDLFTPKTTRIS